MSAMLHRSASSQSITSPKPLRLPTAAEWEHAVLGRHGKTLESDNAFVYRFAGDRIAEMWMFLGADPESAATFFG